MASGEAGAAMAALKRAVEAQSDDTPVYVRIASALAAEIDSGALRHRAKLPAQRVLAQSLGVNLTTVTKSFKYLKERGVVSANAGQGTVVRGRELDHSPPTYERPLLPPPLDLSVIKRHGPQYERVAAAAFSAVLQDGAMARLLGEYRPVAGTPQARGVAAQWLAWTGVAVPAERIAVTSGAQHAMFVVLAATMKPGDIVLVPSLAYQGIKTAARELGLGLIAIAMDAHGPLPEAVEQHARNPRTKALFLMPTLDNPRSITMDEGRRRQLAEIAARHALFVIEDEVHRALCEAPTVSFLDLLPARTFHLSSVAKVLAPGLRCGFLAYPAAFENAIALALRGTGWMADPLSIALVSAMVASGGHVAVMEEQRQVHRRRHALAQRLLGPLLPSCSAAEGNCMWVDLPPTAPSDEVTQALRAQGIGVAPSSIFETGTAQHNGVRIYKGSAADDADWQRAIEALRDTVQRSGSRGDMV